MKLVELGSEAVLVEVLKDRFAANKGDLIQGPGDDAAVFRVGDKLVAIASRMLVDTYRTELGLTDPYDLGWEAALAALNSVAAMGARPTYSTVSVGCDLWDTDEAVVDSIAQGIADLSAKYGSSIAGLSTTANRESIVVNVTQVGELDESHLALRKGAQIGDEIIVTGTLGDAIAAVELIKHGYAGDPEHRDYVQSQFHREPRVNAALAAVETGKVHAMMSLSSGLTADLKKLSKSSCTGAQIYLDRLPMSADLDKAAAELEQDPEFFAATGDMDYELLITCSGTDVAEVVAAIRETGTSATGIGEIIDGHQVLIIDTTGGETIAPRSWDHF